MPSFSLQHFWRVMHIFLEYWKYLFSNNTVRYVLIFVNKSLSALPTVDLLYSSVNCSWSTVTITLSFVGIGELMQIIQQGIILANALRRPNSRIEVVMWYNIKILFGWSCYGLCFIRDDWYIMRWEPTNFMSASIRTEATAEYGLTAKKAVLDFINLTFYWWPFFFKNIEGFPSSCMFSILFTCKYEWFLDKHLFRQINCKNYV